MNPTVWAALLLVVTTALYATPPVAPIRVEIRPRVSRAADSPTAVLLTLRLTADSEARARLRVFADRQALGTIQGAPRFDGSFTIADMIDIPLRLGLEAAGDYEIHAVIEPEGGGVSDGALAYLRLPTRGDIRLLDPVEYASDRPSKMPRRASPISLGVRTIPTLEPRVRMYGNIRVTINGQLMPMRNVRIVLYDSDTWSGDDELIGTVTDANGYYDVLVSADDGVFGGGPDVYIYIESRIPDRIDSRIDRLRMIRTIVPVGVGAHMAAPAEFGYTWRSATINNVQSEARLDFALTESERAAGVWMGVSTSYHIASAALPRPFPPALVRFPGAAISSYSNGTINIDAQAGSSPEAAAHEFAHHVMETSYGTPLPGGEHSFCTNQDPYLAWSEGFANFMGLLAGDGGGTFHWNAGDQGRTLEYYNCVATDITVDEGRVAAALWDLYDDDDDDNEGMPTRGRTGYSDRNQNLELVRAVTLIAPLDQGQSRGVEQYWPLLERMLDSLQSRPAVEIMRYNYYPQP